MPKKPSMKTSEPERLAIKPSVIKRLFAYSGNRCANPGCKEDLVDEGGTMLGKIAHIHAAQKGGARFIATMSDEDRRDFSNLFVVCGKHHDIIDDPARAKEFDAEKLKLWKEQHEAKFKRAERELMDRYQDMTANSQPNYPRTLKAFLELFEVGDYENLEEDLESLKTFIDKLRWAPFEVRDFAVKVAERMYYRNVKSLPVGDVIRVFSMTEEDLKEMGELLIEHGLGEIDDTWGYGRYELKLFDRMDGVNPFIEAIEFCKLSGVDIARLIYDLDFSLYDEIR